MSDSGKSSRAGCWVALLGAIVAHLVAFGLAFLAGANFGSHGFNMIRPGPTAYGWQGGRNAMESLVITYLFSVGIVPVVVSAVGAGLAVVIWRVCRRKTKDGTPPPEPSQ